MPGLTLAAAWAVAKAAELVTTTGTPGFRSDPYCPMNEPSSLKRPATEIISLAKARENYVGLLAKKLKVSAIRAFVQVLE